MLDSDLIGRMRRVMHEHRVTRYATARTYASPHTGAPSTFQGAAQLIHAPAGVDPAVKGWARHWAHQISRHTGLRVRPHTAIGDWAPEGEEAGAEPSTEFMFGGAKDFEHAKYAAALIGRHSNQIQVLPFMHDPNGPHSIYELRSNAEAPVIRKTLDRVGLPYRTLVREKGGHRAVIVDLGHDPDTANNVHRAGQFLGVKPLQTRGYGEFFPEQIGGAEQARGNAMPQYDHIISTYAQKHGIKPFTPQAMHDPLSKPAKPSMMGGGTGGQMQAADRYARKPAPGQMILPMHAGEPQFGHPDNQGDEGGAHPDLPQFEQVPHQPGNGAVYVLDTPLPAKPRVKIPMEPAPRTGPGVTHQDMYNNGLIAAAKRRRDPGDAKRLLQAAAGGGAPKPEPAFAQPQQPAPQPTPAATASAPRPNPTRGNRPQALAPYEPGFAEQQADTNKRMAAIDPLANPSQLGVPKKTWAEAELERMQNSPGQPAAKIRPVNNATLTQIPQGKLYPPGMHPAQRPIAAPPVQPVAPEHGGQFPDLGVHIPNKAKPQPPGIVARTVQALDSPELAIGLSKAAGKAHGMISGAARSAGKAAGRAAKSFMTGNQHFTPAGLKMMGKKFSRDGEKVRYAGQPKLGNSPAAMLEPPAPTLPKPPGYTPGAPTEGLAEYPKQAIKGPLGRNQEFLGGLGKPQPYDSSDDAWDVMHHKGHIVVLSHDKKRMHVIDARNPLDDTDLVNFHKNWKGSAGVAHRVEQAASQHRRMVSADDLVGNMPPSPLNAVAGTPAEGLMRGRMGAAVIAAHNKAKAPAAAPKRTGPGGRPNANQFAERPMPMNERPWHKQD